MSRVAAPTWQVGNLDKQLACASSASAPATGGLDDCLDHVLRLSWIAFLAKFGAAGELSMTVREALESDVHRTRLLVGQKGQRAACVSNHEDNLSDRLVEHVAFLFRSDPDRPCQVIVVTDMATHVSQKPMRPTSAIKGLVTMVSLKERGPDERGLKDLENADRTLFLKNATADQEAKYGLFLRQPWLSDNCLTHDRRRASILHVKDRGIFSNSLARRRERSQIRDKVGDDLGQILRYSLEVALEVFAELFKILARIPGLSSSSFLQRSFLRLPSCPL